MSTGEGKFPTSFEDYQLVLPNELVFCLFDMDETPRTVGLARQKGMVTGAYTCFSINQEIAEPRFLDWYFLAIDEGKRLRPLYTGLRKVIQKPRFLSAGMALPPLPEQRDIADYLDRETTRIDTLIRKQEHLIEMLRERRAAIRDRHFVSTADKRKTSVRRVLVPLTRPAKPGLGVVTAYRDGVVTLRSKRRDEGYTFSDTEHGYQEVCPGDLVFHALDGFAGAVGISDSHGNATPVYHVCRTSTDDEPEYVAMLLRYLGVSGFLATQAPNVRQRSVDFRNWATFARVPLELPDPEIQRMVVRDIRQQTAKIDLLISKTERFIELAKERRSALIAAAVTGHVDVWQAAA
ncbi:hypothetical protein [Kribbella karoonensis]|uniref:hypothetical protein n=1 Tax=Kribbella karoonensis TaxID=324851 RepID=UPI0031E1F44F